LAKFSSFEEIVIADADLQAAQALVGEIGNPRLSAREFNADDEPAMRQIFPEFDVVVNGLPFKYDLPVNKACVEAGVNGLDVSSEDPQFELHEQALEKAMIFIPGVGATPGITNMMVARAAERLDVMHEVDIYFAAFRCLAPAPGLLATTLWEFVPEEEEREEAYFEDGAWQATPPMSGGVEIKFHDLIGEQKVYYVPHDEAYTLPKSYPSLRRAAVRGCFPPHVMELMGALMRAGLLTSREVSLGGETFSMVDVVRDLLWQNPQSKENPVWAYGLVVEVRGERAGRDVVCTYRSRHPPQEQWGGPSAYFKNVGIPLSIGAELIATSQVKGQGVLPPEMALPAAPFFEALAKREILVDEQIVERGLVVD
jgi:lysine 6-dehydrogenase